MIVPGIFFKKNIYIRWALFMHPIWDYIRWSLFMRSYWDCIPCVVFMYTNNIYFGVLFFVYKRVCVR